MGFGDFFSGIMEGTGDVVLNLLSGGGSTKLQRDSRDREIDWMERELEELRKKQKATTEGMQGPEVGADPALGIGEGRILVDDEGVLTMRERFARGEKESVYKIHDKDYKGHVIEYTQEELEYLRKYINKNFEDYYNIYDREVWDFINKGKYKKRYFEKKEFEGGYATGDLPMIAKEGLIKYRKGEISAKELVEKYAVHNYQNLYYDLVMEYRRNKAIDPKLNVPAF